MNSKTLFNESKARERPVICVFTTIFDHGGPTRYWSDIFTQMPEYDFDIFCNSTADLSSPPFAHSNVRYVPLMIWKKPLATMHHFSNYLKERQPETVMFNGTLAEALVFPLVLWQRLRQPQKSPRWSCVYHNIAIYPSRMKNLINRLSLSLMGLWHKKNIFVSDAVKNYWWCRGQTLERPFLLQPKQLTPKGEFVIGFCGRLSPEKGPELFFDVIKKIQSPLPISVMVVGDGLMAEALQKDNPKARFTGWVKDPSPYLRQMDILLSTSYTEGYPLALGEAIEQGTPVFAFAVGGVSEVLKDAGISCLAKAQNSDQLAHLVSDFLADYETNYQRYFTARSSSAKLSLKSWAKAVLC